MLLFHVFITMSKIYIISFYQYDVQLDFRHIIVSTDSGAFSSVLITKIAQVFIALT